MTDFILIGHMIDDQRGDKLMKQWLRMENTSVSMGCQYQ